MAIKFGTWTPSPSARPTPRHGSWCCPSGRRPSAPGGRFGPCTPWRPARNRPCSFKRNASPTRLSRSSWQSDWRERDRAPALPGLRVRAPRERALSRQGRAVLGRRAAVHGRVRRRDLAGGRAALLRGGDGAGTGTGGAAEAGVRAAGRQSGPGVRCRRGNRVRSEEHTSELQSPCNLVCRLLLEKKKKKTYKSNEKKYLKSNLHSSDLSRAMTDIIGAHSA